MHTADFDFQLPANLIAQRPARRRDAARLCVLHRDSGQIEHRRFPELLDYLRRGDVLVLNNSRVIPARLRGINARSGGQFEMLLLEENATNDWWVMLRPGKRARIGTEILLLDLGGRAAGIRATVFETNEEGHRRLLFEPVAKQGSPTPGAANISGLLDDLGEVPLPPYIHREALKQGAQDRQRRRQMMEDRRRYQTVFAQPSGSVAAPTAGLHFTESLLRKIRSRGVEVCFVTLHVGPGTFAPVKADRLDGHKMHSERYDLSEETARVINAAKHAARRIIAVGTTTVRVLEGNATPTRNPEKGVLDPGAGRTQIFIHPPYEFKIVDALLTNFHLPRSTLLVLVSAFAAPAQIRGRELVLTAYREAIREHYRFFSYGDAMLVI